MRKIYLILGLAFIFLLGCENHLEMALPQGPQGDKGDKGEDGMSAFDLWKIFYQKDPNTPIEDFFNSLRGKDGKDGMDGAVPVIGPNGNWYIDGVDTNIPAKGKDGKDGVTPVIGGNDNWWIDGRDTGIPARGKDGATPVIGGNGNWFIHGEDTGVPARGKDGKNGIDGITPQIGGNNNWIIDGKDTGVPVTGKNGIDGIDGATPQVGVNGNWWINGRDTGIPARGKDGIDGVTPQIGGNGNWYINGKDTGVPAKGKDGVNGINGVTPVIGGNGNWYIDGKDTGVPAKGKDGKNGIDGVNPVIGGNGNWWIDGKDTSVPVKGKDGINGINGVTPVIGGNGNWYIEGRDTGVPAKGKDGKDGVSPILGSNGNWYIDGKDTGVRASGVDGATPTIGSNGNWYIGGKDTGVPAKGKDGVNGTNGKDGLVPIIGSNGNWYIDGKDTGIRAKGIDGINGINGVNGVNPTIGTNGNWYIDGKDTGVRAKGIDGINGVTPEIGSNGNWWIDGKDSGQPVKGINGIDGVTPTIGTNGNWNIDGKDTGIQARGKDGSNGTDGKDAPIPVIGGNGNWYIDGKDTGMPSKGADGIEGVTPIIGSNGNWFIKGIDTNVPARGTNGKDGIDGIDGITPEIGSNGNWIVNGVDTGIAAQGKDGANGTDGKDGVNGKTSYELWKDAVDAGEMINKDGSNYTGGNTWEDFLKWLQGGDISVLHQYWLKQGNTGDLQAFIEALFDCHCDGITVIVIAPNECIELNTSGDLTKSYTGTLKVGAAVGSKVQVIGGTFNSTKTVAAGATEVEFVTPRTDVDVIFTVLVTKDGQTEQKSKTARIPALKYIKLGSTSVTQAGTDQKDVATITFATAPAELTVGNTIVYDNINGVTANSGWVVSNSGKTFTKTYDRGSTIQNISFEARGSNGECSILKNLLEIPSLTPVTITGEPSLIVNDCDMAVTMTGTTGMTVKATYSSTTVTMAESPAGVYSYTFPRKYTGYTIDIVASKSGAGNATKKIVVDGNKLLSAPFTYTFNNPSTNNPQITGTFTNPTDKPIEIEFSRGLNSVPAKGKERAPWINGIVGGVNTKRTVTIAAKATEVITFHRDVANDFSNGQYTVTFKTTSQCGELFSRTQTIGNQRDFNYEFKKIQNPGGYPSGPGGGAGGSDPYDPDYIVPTPETGYTIFEVIITDALPGTYVQFLLNTSNGFGPVWTGGAKKTDANGTLKILVKMKDSDIAIANGKKGEIKFSQEKVSSQFLMTKEITFNLPN